MSRLAAPLRPNTNKLDSHDTQERRGVLAEKLLLIITH